ncbi:hypothetical protein RV02_GL002956 [Enterococcus gilvus]|nr:hypothetical protein RV02_GL002956 [Enterococcus gilvus]
MIDEKTGASSIPKIQASTFHQKDLSATQKYTYSRFGNPTVEAMEQAVAALENGEFGIAFSSGVAAISSVLLLLSARDHIVLCQNIYGGTYQIVVNLLDSFNIEYTFVEEMPASNWEEVIKENTKMIYMETPSNPTLKITDIQAVSAIAKEKDIITVCDNTFMTPYYQNPLDLGVDIVIHSGTKFLNGHSDVVAGIVVTNDVIQNQRIVNQRTILGGILGVEDAWLLMRGIKTLGVRMERSEYNALLISSVLNRNDNVKKVYHPSLNSHYGRKTHTRQARGFGSVLSFELENVAAVENFLQKVTIPLVGVSLGGVETILSYPWSMSHGGMTEEEKMTRQVTPELIRLSVGIEDVADLIMDLEQALQ